MKTLIDALPRMSIGLVFFLFGIMQLVNPENWMGYLPDFILSFGDAGRFIFFNGLFDLILGSFLLIGLFVRISAFIGVLHLIGVIFSLGFNDIAVRDLGLLLVLISVLINGKDDYCLDRMIWKIKV